MLDEDELLWDNDPRRHPEEEHSRVEDGWDILERCWGFFKRLAWTMSGGNRDLADELLAEIVDRVPSIAENWNPLVGVDMRPYVFNLSRRYLVKFLMRRSKLREVEHRGAWNVVGDMDPAARHVDEDTVLEVRLLLCRLSEIDADVLTSRLMQDKTFDEIASEYGVSRNTARTMYHEALARAREMGRAEATCSSSGD